MSSAVTCSSLPSQPSMLPQHYLYRQLFTLTICEVDLLQANFKNQVMISK